MKRQVWTQSDADAFGPGNRGLCRDIIGTTHTHRLVPIRLTELFRPHLLEMSGTRGSPSQSDWLRSGGHRSASLIKALEKQPGSCIINESVNRVCWPATAAMYQKFKTQRHVLRRVTWFLKDIDEKNKKQVFTVLSVAYAHVCDKVVWYASKPIHKISAGY